MAEIASNLRISTRMVRYSLDVIDRYLGVKKGRLVKKPKYGVFIDTTDQDRDDLLEEIQQLDRLPLVLSPTERLHTILHMLLIEDEPILVKQLVPRLGVSRTTILKDIDKAEEWLSKFNLSLIRRPNYGFRVVGSEGSWREAIVAALLETAEMPLMLLDKGIGESCQSEIERRFGPLRVWRDFIEDLELVPSERYVSDSQGHLGRKYTDHTYVSLVLHLAVQIWRVAQGKRIEVAQELQQQLKGLDELGVMERIAQDLQRQIGIALSSEEIAFFALQIAGGKVNRPVSVVVGESDLIDVDVEALEVAKDLISAASPYLHPSLQVDELLIRNLALHLRSVIRRLKFGLPITNPLLEDIQKQYGLIYDISRRSSVVLERYVGRKIPEEEIGYLCMHLGAAVQRLRPMLKKRVLVVCSMGIATGWLLVSNLLSEFPAIEVAEVVSVRDLSRANAISSDFDLIISTVPIEIKGIRVVVANPLLTEADKERIREELDRLPLSVPSMQPGMEVLQPALRELITPETIDVHIDACDWQSVVERAGDLLLQIGAIESRYINAMKDVIHDYGAYMVVVPGVILLHAHPEKGVKHLCMSMVTLTHPVFFGHPFNDPVEIAIAIGAVDARSHLVALGQLMDVLKNQTQLDEIRSANSVSAIFEMVQRVSTPK
jgi:mannitol operon transcriptional antiterminator